MNDTEYTIIPIKDMADVITGRTPATDTKSNYGLDYMFITPNDLHGGWILRSSEKGLSEQGLLSISNSTINGISVLVGCIGWDMGNVAICMEKCATNQQINAITNFKEGYNPFYVYYWLTTKKDYLFQIASVTRTPILNKSTFEDITIPVPSITVQNKIVSFLTSIDAKIELNKKVNHELEEMAKMIYEYWFVQFDFPDANGKPYRSSGGEMVWNPKIKIEIPKEWNCESMINNSLVEIISPGVEAFNEKEYIATADVNETNISRGITISFTNRETRANMQPSINSVWFAKMKNSIKHIFLNESMKNIVNNSIFSTGFFGLQCSDISFEYISSFVRFSYFEDLKDRLAHGATQQAVNTSDLNNILLIVPNHNILKKYHDLTSGIYYKIGLNTRENVELSKLRDWLLPMLMNRQVTID